MVYVKTHMSPIMKFITLTRALPSLQLFDALWTVFFHTMFRWKETRAMEYLQRYYFREVRLSNLKKQFLGVGKSTYGKSFCWVGYHWTGILGTAPGTGTGSQTLEARHSQWENELKGESRRSPLRVLPSMQELYERWDF